MVSTVSFFGCGGGSSPSQGAPAISNLSYFPNQATQAQGGGTVPIYVTVDAVDIDGNMSTITFTSYDSLGNVSYTATDPLQSHFFSDRMPGPITITGSMDTTSKGIYTFEIYITDSNGLRSNVLPGTFSVT